MPNYTFALRDGSDPIEDDVGVTLTDRQHAYQYAQGVVLELMSGREAQTRTWRLDVYENSAERVFEIPLSASIGRLRRCNRNCASSSKRSGKGIARFARALEASCGRHALASLVLAASPT